MSDDAAKSEAPGMASRAGFIAALHWGVEAAVARESRRLVLVDADYAEWPLDDAVLLQRLTGWLRLPRRRLVLLARSYDVLPRRCPRFCAWRRDWSHAVEPRVAPEELAAGLPTLLVSDTGISVHLADAVQWRGTASADPRVAHGWTERCDVVLQRSEPGWPVHTLGL